MRSGARGPLRSLAALLLAAAAAGQGTPSWRIANGEVRVTCPLTVGGAFEAKSAALAGELTLADARPASFAGELRLDLRTLDSGIGLRNDHMRDKYLEVGRGDGFATAVLTELRLAEADAASFAGRTAFTATLALHGVRKPVAGHAVVRRGAAAIGVEAEFPVRLADFAIEKPRYLGVGVKDEVRVKVSLSATEAR